MQKLNFEYPASKSVTKRAYVGVVGSGDLEVLLEPAEGKKAHVMIRTRFDGFEKIWKDILDKFFRDYDIAANIEINDFGATPGVIKLRLLQAVEVSKDDSIEE